LHEGFRTAARHSSARSSPSNERSELYSLSKKVQAVAKRTRIPTTNTDKEFHYRHDSITQVNDSRSSASVRNPGAIEAALGRHRFLVP
jgi:hypothetical protein